MPEPQLTISGVTDDDLVVCEGCGTIHESASALLRELRQKVGVLQDEVTQKLRIIGFLRGEDARRVERNPRYGDACEILELWKSTCSPRSKAVTESRAKLVIQRLEDFSKEELEQCVLGYAKFPYVVHRKREPMGKPSERFVKIETIFKETARIEHGIELSERDDDRMHISEVLVSRLSWRRVRAANKRVLTRWLRYMYGQLDEDAYGNLLSPCPRCESDTFSLRIFGDESFSKIAECWNCGATEVQLMDLIDRKAVAA